MSFHLATWDETIRLKDNASGFAESISKEDMQRSLFISCTRHVLGIDDIPLASPTLLASKKFPSRYQTFPMCGKGIRCQAERPNPKNR
ncbi:hypothetical protein SDC9_96950 [bioreactor metagenome]|uniref:Uncharacterized protein n=1 Tax=bioreactor metagenome TaxID=1076179 RepID=A0A645AKL7_9ZZZZ